ncbi:MAG: hypothetical protein EXS63_07835 [Candidatus Omnitrophica bacterium]|nr:hypothetical protein [Candidatus Omnitrophota bacterium]
MKEKTEKRKYETPKLVRVVLNHDQAILAGCSTSTVSLTGSAGAWCYSTCRRAAATGAQSACRS